MCISLHEGCNQNHRVSSPHAAQHIFSREETGSGRAAGPSSCFGGILGSIETEGFGHLWRHLGRCPAIHISLLALPCALGLPRARPQYPHVVEPHHNRTHSACSSQNHLAWAFLQSDRSSGYAEGLLLDLVVKVVSIFRTANSRMLLLISGGRTNRHHCRPVNGSLYQRRQPPTDRPASSSMYRSAVFPIHESVTKQVPNCDALTAGAVIIHQVRCIYDVSGPVLNRERYLPYPREPHPSPLCSGISSHPLGCPRQLDRNHCYLGA